MDFSNVCNWWRFAVLNYSWLWLILHAVLSTYMLSYEYVWRRLMEPSIVSHIGLYHGSTYRIGLLVIILPAVLKLAWISCWLPCLYYTWLKDRSWTSGSTTKLIMQANRNYGTSPNAPRDAAGNLTVGVSGRPRTCPKCHKRCGDRVYHEDQSNRCLPLFDHFCKFMRISVYLRTMKLYLYVLIFLPLDLIVTLVFASLATGQSTGRSTWMFCVPIICASPVLIEVALENTIIQWYLLAWKNQLHGEGRSVTLVFKVRLRHQRTILRCKQYDNLNPWDLGYKENLRQALGETWLVGLCPWIPPARVRNYYKNPGRAADFIFRKEVWNDQRLFVNAPPPPPPPMFTGVAVERSEPVAGPSRQPQPQQSQQQRPMAIDFLVPHPRAQQEAQPPEQQQRRGLSRRTGARSSAVEPSSEADGTDPRHRGKRPQ
ncbi:hypothetical protein DL762_001836 [Monosporascus cannonballus]|uniref:Palmitoyltransferase n=1 Tax=Monosporascus cannonballus TaxID=155416 RepID=A0ABY0HJ80_9PEZI|nr:hypothetical protein DL762_001836 [Monosporascus cannonballus]